LATLLKIIKNKEQKKKEKEREGW